MSYRDRLDNTFIAMGCAAVNWQNLEEPSNHAVRVAAAMRKIFDAEVAPGIDRHLAAAAEIITEQHDALKIKRDVIEQAWEALGLESNPGHDSLSFVIQHRLDEAAERVEAAEAGKPPTPSPAMHTPRVRKASDRAWEYSGPDHMNTAHLLVALLDDNESLASQAVGGANEKIKATARELTHFYGDTPQ